MARQLAAQADPVFDSPGRTLLETHYDLIQQKLTRLGRRSGLPEHEAEELCSWALFKLVENDYRLLAAWEGRSSFSTYLTVLLVNLMRDYRIHVWGKWRPSAAAQRRGRGGVVLERPWLRDRPSPHEAIPRVRAAPGTFLSPAPVGKKAIALPPRPPR